MTKVRAERDFQSAGFRGAESILRGHRVRAVLFDLDGTLYRQRLLRLLMAAELVTLPLSSPLKARRRLIALRTYRRAQEALRGHPSDRLASLQLERAATASGLSVAEVAAVVDEWMMKRPLKYLQVCRTPGLTGLLAQLDRLGIRAGILSDYPAEAKLRSLGLEGRFSPILTATDPEIGAFKPNPRGYRRACEVWHLPPSDVLFVGDRADVDAAGAAAAGMRCVILGPTTHPSGDFAVISSLERLSRVLDHQ